MLTNPSLSTISSICSRMAPSVIADIHFSFKELGDFPMFSDLVLK